MHKISALSIHVCCDGLGEGWQIASKIQNVSPLKKCELVSTQNSEQ